MDKKDVNRIAQLAQLGLLYEVSCFPKPGLVDPVDSGSHSDMDIFTFLESSVVLLPYFESFIQVGFELKNKSIDQTFQAIRKIGLEAEDAMLKSTKRVNTHKGAIFSLGIFLSIAGRLELTSENIPMDIKTFRNEIRLMTSNLLSDFENLESKSEVLTFGEQLFLEHGLTGIRGEAHSGYPSIFEKGLPFYLEYDGKGHAQLIDTLLHLSLYVEDTNLIKRGGSVETLRALRESISNYFNLGGYGTQSGFAYLTQLNECFKKDNWSLGGSADALVLVVFLSKMIEEGYLK